VNGLPADWIVPKWSTHPSVRALITSRNGGISQGAWSNMNVGLGCGDRAEDVQANRAWLQRALPQPPRWLNQVHGATVVDAEQVSGAVSADAAIALTPNVVCAVLVADCMPVLLAERSGRAVGIAHAGWRGLAAGVIQNAVRSMRARLGDAAADVQAYFGPAIGPARFEVGADVLAAMQTSLPQANRAFIAGTGEKYLTDLYALGRMALAQEGVVDVAGGGLCTATDARRFFSFRRDGVTGRQAAIVWLA